MLKKIRRYLLDPDYRFLVDSSLGKHRSMDDEAFLYRVYHARLGKELHLHPPVTFNEKLQWLKLHDRRPEYRDMADKATVKDYISQKIGNSYIVPTIGVFESFDDIDFESLPNSFVLKCTHDSGGLVICYDKASFNKEAAKKTLNRFLKRDYYSQWREWQYKDIPKRIIAEEYIASDDNGLTDYKIHCFNGEPKLILVCKDRFSRSGLTEDFFNENWEHLDVRRPDYPNASSSISRPELLDEIMELSRILAGDIPFVRIDWYIVNEKILFSEITFYPASGLTAFVPESWDDEFGKWLSLPV